MNHIRESDLHFDSRRSPVVAQGGIVATSQPLAVAAGLEVLQLGGNAADAAVATAAALNVAEPTSTGIGGDVFALYYDASTGEVTALNASGRAPASLTLELLRREGHAEELPPYHAHTITVPGACAGWCDMVSRHGNLSMADVLIPAMRLAQEGFPVSPLIAHGWGRSVGKLSRATGGGELLIDGRAPRAGEVFRNPGLARTFAKVAEGGKEAFYEGQIASAVAAAVQEAGGVLQEADMAAHHSTWEQPVETTYRGVQVLECPPNGQGLVALLALNLLEGFDLTSMEPLSPGRLHLVIEALRLAFADGRRYIADPAHSTIPIHELLSPGYADDRRRHIDPHRANLNHPPGQPLKASGTVYLTVVDHSGNACSFINSNYMGFGTGIVPSGWGFSLQNRGHNFSLDPDHPNVLAPGKRPYHTIIPAIALREDGSLYASFGVMGSFMQPQGHVQVLTALLDDWLDPQAALDRLRVCLPGGSPSDTVAVETGIQAETIESLRAMGHSLSVVQGHQRALFGRGQIILRDPTNEVYWAGSDPRADGCAMAVL